MFISNDRCYNLEWDFILFGYNLVMFISNDRCYNLEWDFILFWYNVWKNEFLYIEAFADTCIRICRYSALVLVPALMKIPSFEKICMLLGNVCLYVCLYFYNISPPSYYVSENFNTVSMTIDHPEPLLALKSVTRLLECPLPCCPCHFECCIWV